MFQFDEFSPKPPPGIAAGPITEDNFFEWEAAITGPEGTYFEDGVFIATLSFPQDYPLNPPKMRFKSELFHPNIYPDGRVCIRKVIGSGYSDTRHSAVVNTLFIFLPREI